MLISGTQLTLEVPPVSTVLGLINAAAGKYLRHASSLVGYYFEYQGKGVDIETIYMAEVNKNGKLLATTRSNAIRREFLFDTFLRLYTPDKALINYFRCPVYPLLLGRSSDLATIDARSFRTRTVNVKENADNISGQVIPYATAPAVCGKIQALSKYFSDSIPRQMFGKAPYVIVNCESMAGARVPTVADTINDKIVDIYLHQIDISQF
jgi:CRISPR-associated protein Cas5t